MDQVTLRLDDRLGRDLRAEARRRGMSLNAFAAMALEATVSPDSADGEVQRIRERLRRAGVLAEPTAMPAGTDPGDDAVDEVRRRLRRDGVTASETVRQDRDDRG